VIFFPTFIALTLHQFPLAEAWPYAAKALLDGTVEYRYDLSVLKRQQYAESAERYGEAAVEQFLLQLPSETVARVQPRSIEISSFEGHDAAPLAPSFASVSSAPLQSLNPLAHRPGAQLRVALHPDEPKVLFSVDAALSVARAIEDGVVAAVLRSTDVSALSFWNALLRQALVRASTASSDEREGAVILAARIAASNSCRRQPSIPSALPKEPEAQVLWSAEVNRWKNRRDASCGQIRNEILAEPFENSRGGAAAVLTFFELVKEPQLKRFYEQQLAFQQNFVGEPANEPLLAWKQLASAHESPFENLDSILAARKPEFLVPPSIWPKAASAIERYAASLDNGPASSQAFEETAQALADSRLDLKSTGRWPQERDLSMASLVHTEKEADIQFDSSARARFASAFALSLGGHIEAKSSELTPVNFQGTRSELKIQLNAPPLLEVEPAPRILLALAQSLESLEHSLRTQNLSGTAVSLPKHSGSVSASVLLSQWIPIFKGLSALAHPRLPSRESQEVKLASKFLQTWRQNVWLAQDIRRVVSSGASAAPRYSVLAGVTREAFQVTYLQTPKSETASVGLFEINTDAAQHYLVPTRFVVDANSKASALTARDLKRIFDSVRGDPGQMQTAVLSALDP
jgi:hypothetical protein